MTKIRTNAAVVSMLAIVAVVEEIIDDRSFYVYF